MAQPLSAEYRLTLNIVAASLPHKLRTFVEASASILAASGYFLFERTGIADIDTGDAADSLWTALKPVYDTTVSAPTWTLENRSGNVWNPVATGSCTGSGSHSGGVEASSQLTVSMRTVDFQRVRMVILEGDVFFSGQKAFGTAGLAAISGCSTLAAAISGSDSDASGYFQFARSKNKKLLNEGAPIVSATFDLNDKVRRARGTQ